HKTLRIIKFAYIIIIPKKLRNVNEKRGIYPLCCLALGKFLRRFFQKATGVRGSAPLNAVFWFFFAAAPSKKNGEGFLT
ncbi:MAG: hypothetical protein J6S28_03155, partial [Clostridia bacterium]|nr:hypothetical protein [Clostridia bacterium]